MIRSVHGRRCSFPRRRWLDRGADTHTDRQGRTDRQLHRLSAQTGSSGGASAGDLRTDRATVLAPCRITHARAHAHLF